MRMKRCAGISALSVHGSSDNTDSEGEKNMSLVVKHAVYGALPSGASTNAKAFDVTAILQRLINNNGSVVCNNANFGDPSPGNEKHFGAVVTRNGQDFFFACDENQTIDFNHDGGTSRPPSSLTVKFAVFGALPGGSPSNAQAFDVSGILQSILNEGNPSVACNDQNFGDPSPNNKKHFAAIVTRNGRDFHFACQEGQVIDFAVSGG
jgi:hypothetical protein